MAKWERKMSFLNSMWEEVCPTEKLKEVQYTWNIKWKKKSKTKEFYQKMGTNEQSLVRYIK